MAISHRQALGRNIRRYRQQIGLSQEQLAEKSDLTYKYLGEVERGTVNISLDSMVRIAKALRVKLHELIGNR